MSFLIMSAAGAGFMSDWGAHELVEVGRCSLQKLANGAVSCYTAVAQIIRSHKLSCGLFCLLVSSNLRL